MIIGLSMDGGADFRAHPGSKNGQLFAELDRRWGVPHILQPELSPLELRLHQLRRFHPDTDTWRRRFNLHPRTFARRTSRAEAELARFGTDALVFQLHTLVAPGTRRRPYVLHTDATYLLTERNYRRGAPLRGRAREAWLASERKVYQGARALFPRSEWVRRSMIEDYGCDPERVVAVGGGTNLSRPNLDGRRWDRPVAVFVGLEAERKGLFELLRAWGQVRTKLPEAELHIVGLEGQAQSGVHWHGRVSDRAVLAQHYQDASVFVMPSRFEPWGHVFLEAMGAGLPCIGTDGCAMPEIITPERGLLVPPKQPDALAAALLALLDDPARAERLGRAAHAHAHHETWSTVVERMVELLEPLLR